MSWVDNVQPLADSRARAQEDEARRIASDTAYEKEQARLLALAAREFALLPSALMRLGVPPSTTVKFKNYRCELPHPGWILTIQEYTRSGRGLPGRFREITYMASDGKFGVVTAQKSPIDIGYYASRVSSISVDEACRRTLGRQSGELHLAQREDGAVCTSQLCGYHPETGRPEFDLWPVTDFLTRLLNDMVAAHAAG